MAYRSKSRSLTSDRDSESSGQKADKAKRVPISLTEQVLVGFLNEVFSSCLFRSVPKIGSNPVPLTNNVPLDGQLYYMLSLKWTKSGILTQSISHTFSVYDGDQTYSQDENRRYGEVGTLISVGLFTALKSCLKEPFDGPKVPLSILNGFIKKEINRGGNWAYMCSPSFLKPEGSAGVDGRKDPRKKLLKVAGEELDVISPSTIVCILWSLYYTNSYKNLTNVCTVLCSEFIQNHYHDKKNFVYLLYLCKRMGMLGEEQLEELIASKFNSMASFESLTVPDALVLSNIVDSYQRSQHLSQRLSNLVYYHIEEMDRETVVYLLTGLIRLNFNFQRSDVFTKKLLSRVLRVYDEVPSGDELLYILFNSLSIMRYDVVGYLNEVLSKTLNRLHILSANEILMIGCSYAIGKNTSEMVRDLEQAEGARAEEIKNVISGNQGRPQSEHLYHCLEFQFRTIANGFRAQELHLLSLIHGSVVYSLKFNFSPSLGKGFLYDARWREAFSQHPKISNSGKTAAKVDMRALEAEGNNPAYSNSFKMYFLNIIEDCFNNFDDYDDSAIGQLIFSLLSVKIDLTRLYEAMLVSKGDLIRKSREIITVRVVEKGAEMRKQYEMARDIMSWTWERDGNEGPLSIAGLTLKSYGVDVLERDLRNEGEAKGPEPAAELRPEPPEKRAGDTPRAAAKTSAPEPKKSSETKAAEKPKHSASKARRDKESRPPPEEPPRKQESAESAEDGQKPNPEYIKDLIKTAAKLPVASLVPGNPIYDLLKFYTGVGGEGHGESSQSQLGSAELSRDDDDEGEEYRFAAAKGGRKQKDGKLPKHGSGRDDRPHSRAETSASPYIGHMKTKKKPVQERKRYETFFRIKTIKKTRMVLDKREIQVVYKYVKVRR